MREADIRPAHILDEYLRLAAADARTYFPENMALRRRACPGCDDAAPSPAFTKVGFDYVTCGTCGSLYVLAVPPPDRLAAFYRDSPSQRYWAEVFFPSVADARRRMIFRPRAERIRDLTAVHAGAPDTVVDVGAGAGIFLDECRAAGLGTKHRAVEPNARLAEACRRIGFDTFEGFADDAAADAAWGDTNDLVTSFEVIEHVADAAAYVNGLARLARPGGLIVVSGLGGDGFDIVVLGRHSKAVSPPHHLNFLSRRGVSRLLERCGLEEVAFLTPGALDVDIVRNTLRELPDAVTEPFIRRLVLDCHEDVRAAFQTFLADSGLSSHMWIIARRPA